MFKNNRVKEIKPKYIIISSAILYAIATILVTYNLYTNKLLIKGNILECVSMLVFAITLFLQKEKAIKWASYLCAFRCIYGLFSLIGASYYTTENVFRLAAIGFAYIAMVLVMTVRIVRAENKTILIFYLVPALIMMIAYYLSNKMGILSFSPWRKWSIILEIVSLAFAGFWKFQLLFDKKDTEIKGDLQTLTTAEDIYQYCKDNGFGSGMGKGSAIKHFQVVMDQLKPNEEIQCAFMGLHNYRSGTENSGFYAYIMTDKRMIMGQHGMIGSDKISVINNDDIEDITTTSISNIANSGVGLGKITFSTNRGPIMVGANVEDTKNIYKCVHDVLENHQKA